jgi:hypothetical protein
MGLLAVVLTVPGVAAAALPEPTGVEVIDVPNDDGTALGVLWDWVGRAGPDTRITIEIQVSADTIKEFALNEAEAERLADQRAKLKDRLAPVLPELSRLKVEVAELQEQKQGAEAAKLPEAKQIRHNYWLKENELKSQRYILDESQEGFTSRVTIKGKSLYHRQQTVEYIAATLDKMPWVPTIEVSGVTIRPGDDWPTKGQATHRFGHNPTEAGKIYYEVHSYNVFNPDVLDGTYSGNPNDIGFEEPQTIKLDLHKNTLYNLRLKVERLQMAGDDLAKDENGQPIVLETATYPLGGGTPRVNYFNRAFINNLVFAVSFAIIILVAIMLARRNPNMFIRRISGLEAVDEAIGRATEMGKPVLYLCGLDPLSTLSTLAAVNILGRVARRIADYDSDLIVPNRDPVVLTVAQEVVREAYIDQGRPDAYKEDNIFFVTDDQFSYTATTCAIMMREKPAANFFMGYYYAESLLLAETGAATGAIQIAGTDALHQLPFFITTCDYTLIGEELYAASAYLSREPLLLGSLKGQDLGKAIVMVLIIVQTLLFIFSSDWNWLKLLVEPL